MKSATTRICCTALAADLGNPAVSLSLYKNAGAQFVFPTPIDPVPLRDRALATGLFTNVGMVRGNSWLHNSAA